LYRFGFFYIQNMATISLQQAAKKLGKAGGKATKEAKKGIFSPAYKAKRKAAAKKKKPVAKKSATKKPVAKKAATKKPVAKKAATRKVGYRKAKTKGK
jgi:hypothetical protein